MKLIDQAQISSDPRDLGPLRSLKVQTLDGVLYVKFDGGAEVTLEEGDVIELPVGMLFANARIRGQNGTTGTVLFGMVSFASAGNGGGSSEAFMSGDSIAPNADGITPADTDALALYFSTANLTLYVWNPDTQAWI